MLKFFGDNVNLHIRTGIEDLQAVLNFLSSSDRDTCIGFRILEHPYNGIMEHPYKKNDEANIKIIPTLEIVKYKSCGPDASIQNFLSPLLPSQMYDQIYAWLLKEHKNTPEKDRVFSDVDNHYGFTLYAGWFDISMSNVKFQIWPSIILYGK